MALILSTDRYLPLDLSAEETWQVYNGLDCAITHQAYTSLRPLLSNMTGSVYQFQMELQVLAIEMMQRGLRVDNQAKAAAIAKLSGDENRIGDIPRLLKIIERYALAIWKKPLNPNSHTQLKDIFYNFIGLPKQYKFEKGERKLTTNRQALEKLELYFHATALVKAIIAFKDASELLKVLTKELSHDGRMRFSYNVGATETGRWSSSVHPLGSGTNGQNITDEIRRIFEPDPGCIFINFDLVTAESLGVAYLSGDEKYRTACESGDLHTLVARLVWPNLNWTGDLKRDRAIADLPFYRHFSYRDMAKRGGHLSNYLGTPPVMAQHLRLPRNICHDFQELYFSTFSLIPAWHIEVQAELQLNKRLITPMGRVRQFFGRLDERETLKEAVAFLPQSTIVDIINTGALRLWKAKPWVQFLMQVHDSILIQVPINRLEETLEFPKLLDVAVPIRGKEMHIPVEMAIGWNWGKRIKLKDGTIENPRGLRKISNAELLELARELR